MRRIFRVAAVITAAASSGVATCAESNQGDENERVIVLEAFTVNANPIENFGFQVGRQNEGARRIVVVIAVVPNTAASKAGLKPGDHILESDGTAVTPSPRRWLRETDWHGFYVPPSKRPLVAQGSPVSWTLKVKEHESRQIREVTLTLPTAPPRWGAKTWVAPEGRAPASVPEEGCFADLAKLVLDNGVAIMLREDLARTLPHRSYYFGHQWSVAHGRSFIVSQTRGRTDIIIQAGKNYFLTSPNGKLETAVRNEHVPQLDPWAEIPFATAHPAFQEEVHFWLHSVGKVSPRWPLELLPSDRANASTARLRKLPPITAAQKALFD